MGTPQTLQTHALQGRSCPDSLIAQERPRCPCSEQAASPGCWRCFQRGGGGGGGGGARWAADDAGVWPLTASGLPVAGDRAGPPGTCSWAAGGRGAAAAAAGAHTPLPRPVCLQTRRLNYTTSLQLQLNT